MASKITLEVCIDSLESAQNAVRGGADRLEVCANLGLGGGTTPSFGLVKTLRTLYPDVPLMVMIRPRIGDFLYNQGEIEVMLEDIEVFKQAGVSGAVLGVLDEDAAVNVEQTQMLIDEALPMQICFHRAFDMTRDVREALDQVSKLKGVTRVLTSGHGLSVPASLPVLQNLLEKARGADSPTILPGSGVNGRTIRSVLDALLPFGLTEVHMSGGQWIAGGMKREPAGMGMGADGHEWQVWRTDEKAVRAVRCILDEVL